MQGPPHAEPPTTRHHRAGDRRLARLPHRAGRLRRRRQETTRRAATTRSPSPSRARGPVTSRAPSTRSRSRSQDFMDDNPDIIVEPVEWEWTAETFATQLAGDTLPTMFPVPSSRQGRSRARQIADVTEYVEALPYAAEFNPSVLEAAKGTDGKIYGAAHRRLRHGPALQPGPVRAGRARPRLARRRRGTRYASTPSRSPTRPARPATSDERQTTPAAGCSPR